MPRPAVRRLLTISLLLALIPLGIVLLHSIASARGDASGPSNRTSAGPSAATGAMASLARRMEGWIDPEFEWYGYPGNNPSSVDVEIRFCSEFSFDEGTFVVTRQGPEDEEGVDITSDFWWQVNEEGTEPNCEFELVAEGDVDIEMGTTTVEGTVCDSPMFWCGVVLGEYTIEDTTSISQPPAPPPAPAIPIVSAVASTIGAPPGASNVTQKFLVRNRASTQKTYNLTKTCVTPASSCTGPTSVVVPANGDATVTVTHSTSSGSSGQTGIVTLKATEQGNVAVTSSDSVRVLVGHAAVSDTAAIDTTATRARELCVMVAAGPGASQCGDLVLAHALPSVRVLGTTRTPTLLYNSATAHPMVLLPVNVAFPSGATSVDAVLTIWNGSASYQSTTSFGSWTAGQARRLVVGRDVAALGLGTGVYPYTIDVRKLTSGVYSTIKLVSGQVAVVNRSQSPFGAGWWLAGLEELKSINDTTKLWIGGDGSTRIYAASGGVWRARSLARPDSMISLGGGQLCRKLPGGACVVFDSASGKHVATRGRLSMTGTNTWGFKTNFGYTGGRLAAIHIPHATGSGDTYTFSYANNSGQTLSSVAAPANGSEARSVTLYTTGFRVDSIKDPDATKVKLAHVGSSFRVGTYTNRVGRASFFAFDAGGKLSQVRIPANPADTITVGLQALESRGFTGGSTGVPIEAAKAYTRIDGPRTDVADSSLVWLNALGAPRRIRDALGFETALSYSSTWPALVTKVEAPNGFTSEATYDAKGRLATQTAKNPYGGAPAGDATTRYVWNAWDAVDSIVPPVGPVTTFGYDPGSGNRIWQQVGPSSTRRVTFAYYTTHHHVGLLRGVTSPTIAADSLVYDTVRVNLIQYVSPAPRRYRTTYAQDDIGRVVVVTAPLDTLQATHDSVITTYDIMDRVIETVTRAPGDIAWQSAIVATEYDPAGRPISVARSSEPDDIGAGELVTGTEYDWAGRAVASVTYGAKDTMRLDLAGNVVWTKTRRGHELTMRYDALGRLIERVVPGVSYDNDQLVELGLTIRFPFYPNNGRGLLIPPEVTRFWYDHAGQIRRAVNADAEIVRSYYPNGQLRTDTLRIRSTDRSTQTSYGMSHAYDLAGRDTSLTYPGTTGRARYAYHDAAAGQLAQVTAPDGDKFGFVWNLGGQLVNTTVTPNGWSARTFYDSLTYDSEGYIKTRKAERTAAAVQTGWSGRHTETRVNDPRGRVRRIYLNPHFEDDPNQVDFEYSGLGALVSRVEEGATGPETWHADALGHRVSTKVPDAGRVGGVETSSLRKNYLYQRDRVVWIGAEYPHWTVEHATYPDETTFEYDSAGNVVHEYTAMYKYAAATPSLQQLVAVKKMRSWYGADEKLRVIQRHDATYDVSNAANIQKRGAFEEYRYDPLGRRVMAWSRAGSDTVCNQTGCTEYINTFVWNGDQLLTEHYRGNDIVYVHGLGIDRPLKMGEIIPHADYRGVYDAGNLSTGEEKQKNYPGQSVGAFHDEGVPRLTGMYASLLQGGMDQSGLAYRRNRYYDPATGRFTQQDPIGLAGGLNLYGFAGGDPVNYSDPFGLKPCPPDNDCWDANDSEAVIRQLAAWQRPINGAVAVFGAVSMAPVVIIGGSELLAGNAVRHAVIRYPTQVAGRVSQAGFTRTETIALRTFFKENLGAESVQLTQGASRSLLLRYRAVAVRALQGEPGKRVTEAVMRVQTERIRLIDEALKLLK